MAHEAFSLSLNPLMAIFNHQRKKASRRYANLFTEMVNGQFRMCCLCMKGQTSTLKVNDCVKNTLKYSLK